MQEKKNNINIIKLSDESVVFIKEYLLPMFPNIQKVDDDSIDDFIGIAFDWESLMVDENGNDKIYDYDGKERNEMADRFVSEISGKWSSGLWTIDFEELNKRLNL